MPTHQEEDDYPRQEEEMYLRGEEFNNSYNSEIGRKYLSTKSDPLKFFKGLVKLNGESFLEHLYNSYDRRYGFYDEETKLIWIIKSLPPGIERGELLDAETNEREYSLNLDQFVLEEVSEQINFSIKLLNEKREANNPGQNAMLYFTILVDCLEIQKKIDSSKELKYAFVYSNANRFIIDFAVSLFEKYFPKSREKKQLDNYFKKLLESNVTGFMLCPQVRKFPLVKFYQELIKQKFISKADAKYFDQFLNGKIPERKINWLKELYELKFFIDCICDEQILKRVLSHHWKILHRVFICQGEELPIGWQKNNNKLKDAEKRALIQSLVDMLQSR